MKKAEIARHMGIDISEIQTWAQNFAGWLGICATNGEKDHDEMDIAIFGMIHGFNETLDKKVPYHQRREYIERQLQSDRSASRIKHKRSVERDDPTIARWQIVGHECLQYEYEWLEHLRPEVNHIVSFGCWPMGETITCSEPYALLWSLEASRIVVIDKNQEHIQNARQWLVTTRKSQPNFNDYVLEFVVADMADKALFHKEDKLEENAFDLAYCCRVLYYMKSNAVLLETAVENMVSMVRSGGWLVADEPFAVGQYFEAMGLTKRVFHGAPDTAYCYQKPQ